MIVRGKNSYAARVTDTAQGTIRSLEANVQGFEERATRLEADIADATKRAKELETKVGAHFEREERYQQLTRRQSEIEEKLDLTKNQAPSQVEADSTEANEQKKTEKQTKTHSPRPARRAAIRV
jgi:predicted  nucleic acid-binding Zn-ribbon protein